MPRDYCRKWKGLEFINLNLCHFGNLLKPNATLSETAISLNDSRAWIYKENVISLSEKHRY